MEIDKTTLADLSILNVEDDFSVFNKLNFCRTAGGRHRLFYNFSTPLKTIEEIQGIQKTLQFIIKNEPHWPPQITNGSVLMIEKFYIATIDDIPEKPSQAGVLSYKLFSSADYSFVKFSTEHTFDFIKGMQQFVKYFLNTDAPAPIKRLMESISVSINKKEFEVIAANKKSKDLNNTNQLMLANYFRYRFKHTMQELVEIYYQLDAWYGMAMAVKNHHLVFPSFSTEQKPLLDIKGLYHPLLQQPVGYDVRLLPGKNFLFLTGANMAGKSTFIKSVGTAVFLAHIGMGVPAQSMELSVFDGLLSNINIMDNIVKGESYFYNEVQRIKSTVQKISDHRNWLILIDELFKGTNVQDAMKCSTVVVEGFLKIPNTVFILSTHLYEIGEQLKQYPNIIFNYFETAVNGEELVFNYQLKDGISNDRLGYVILKNEGVVDMLQKL
ncbi:MAG: DNA mismatch repair protein MutS [Bacteroidota bacterium]